MKGWVKAGLIGLIVPLIIGTIWYLSLLLFSRPGRVPLSLLLFFVAYILLPALFSLMGIFGCNFKEDVCGAENVFGVIVSLIVYFGFGVLVRWIFLKIKNRNK